MSVTYSDTGFVSIYRQLLYDFPLSYRYVSASNIEIAPVDIARGIVAYPINAQYSHTIQLYCAIEFILSPLKGRTLSTYSRALDIYARYVQSVSDWSVCAFDPGLLCTRA